MKLQIIAISGCVAVIILFGLVLFGLGARNVWRAAACARWPTTGGTVLASGISNDTTVDRKTGATSVAYSAKIVFGYNVDGKDYTTETIYFGQVVGSGDSSEAELRRIRYAPGAQVKIFYNPSDPSIAAVKPGVNLEAFLLPGAGLGFAVPGVMFLVLFLASEKVFSTMELGVKMFAVIFCLIGVAFLGLGVRRLWYAWASDHWPITDGVVIYGVQQSNTSVERDDEDELNSSTSYSTNLVYKYEVGGEPHYANVRRFGQLAASSKDWAEDIARRYFVGAKVVVSYNPSDPDLAALEPGITSEAWWLPGAGASFLLFGLAVWIWIVPAIGRDF
jgi:Protein of unknown function (DUF3592)